MSTLSRATVLSAALAFWLGVPLDARAQLDLRDPVDEFPAIQPAGTLKGHEKFVWGVAFSPDGSKIATAGEDVAMLWDGKTGKLLHKLVPGEADTPSAHAVAFSPDGKTLAVGGYVGDVFFYDPETGKLKGKFDEPSLAILSLAYSPDGATLAATHDQNSIMLYDVKAAKLLGTLKPSKGSLQMFALSNDGKTVVAITREELRFWDVPARTLKKAIGLETPDPSANFAAVACSPAAPVAVVNGGKLLDQKTFFYDLKTFRPKGGLVSPPNEPSIKSLCFSPDGKTLATGASAGIRDRTPVSLWDVSNGQRFGALVGPSEGVSQVAFSADGRRVAASSLDKLVRVWDLPASGTKAGAKGKAKGKAKAKRSRR